MAPGLRLLLHNPMEEPSGVLTGAKHIKASECGDRSGPEAATGSVTGPRRLPEHRLSASRHHENGHTAGTHTHCRHATSFIDSANATANLAKGTEGVESIRAGLGERDREPAREWGEGRQDAQVTAVRLYYSSLAIKFNLCSHREKKKNKRMQEINTQR